MSFSVYAVFTGKEPCFSARDPDRKLYLVDNHSSELVGQILVIGYFNPETEEHSRHFYSIQDSKGRLISDGRFLATDVTFVNEIKKFLEQKVSKDNKLNKSLISHIEKSSNCLNPYTLEKTSPASVMNIADNEIWVKNIPKVYLWRSFEAFQKFSHKVKTDIEVRDLISKMEKTKSQYIEEWEYSIVLGSGISR